MNLSDAEKLYKKKTRKDSRTDGYEWEYTEEFMNWLASKIPEQSKEQPHTPGNGFQPRKENGKLIKPPRKP